MPEFNPANAAARSAFEVIPGANPVGATYHDQKIVSEDLTSAAADIETGLLSGSLFADAASDGKAETGGTVSCVGHTEQHIVPIAVAMRQSATPVNPTGSVWQHRLAPSQPNVTFARSMVQEIDRDDGEPLALRASRVTDLQWGSDTNNPLLMQYTLSAESFDGFGPPAIVSDVTTNTHNPILRGLPRFDLRADGSSDFVLHVQVSTITDLPTSFEVVCKVGTAASYGATVSTVYVGVGDDGRPNWTGTLVDSTSGAPIGTGELPVEIWQQSVTGIEVGDEWTFANPRTVWTPSPSAAPNLISTGSRLYATNRAGSKYESCYGSWQVNVTPPFGEDLCTAGRWPRYDVYGNWAATVAFGRAYTDLLYRHRRDNSQTFPWQTVSRSASPITGAYYHEIKITAPAVKLTSTTKVIGGQDDREEALEGQCQVGNWTDPDTGTVYTDPLTVEITNTIADLTA